MSTTIMMPQSIDLALNELVSNAMEQAVAKLSDKYGFDSTEASRFLELDSVKIARKRGSVVKKTKKVDKEAKKAKKAEKEAKPKRAPTGYLMYSNVHRAEVKAQLLSELDEDVKLKPQDTVRKLAVNWKSLTDAEREEWKIKGVESVSQPTSEVESESESKQEADSDEELVMSDAE